MLKHFFALLLMLAAVVPNVVSAPQQPVRNAPSRPEIFPLSEVKEGLRGTARTVFRGSEPEDFGVEILGVVPGAIGPKQDLVVARLSGGSSDRTSVFAGMSGSPVYIGGRLVGAISYSFPFAKEPICGITPIEQMIEIFETQPPIVTAGRAASVSLADVAADAWQGRSTDIAENTRLLAGAAPSSLLNVVSGQAFRPIATPLTFGGFSQKALDAYAPQLIGAGLIPVAAVGGSSPITTLKKADQKTLLGGYSVSMQLARGDYSMAAAGTVTLRDGEKIYAFGHPFLSLGTSSLPMSESSVVTVVPSLNNSFKLAVPDSMVGSMLQDRATGVFGTLGVAPKMIPVTINLQTSRGLRQAIKFEIAKDDFLTPLLMNIAVYNTLIAQERTVGDATVELGGMIDLANGERLNLRRRFAGSQAAQLSAAAVAAPVSLVVRSRFEAAEITGIELNLKSGDGSRTAVVERLVVDRSEARPGEKIGVSVYARTNTGAVVVRKSELEIPQDAAAGVLTLTAGDGVSIQQNSAIQQLVAGNASELVAVFNKVKYADRFYIQASRNSAGAVVGSSEMPNLPPSVLATLGNDRTAGGVKASMNSLIAETELPTSDFIISGSQSINVSIVR